MEALRAYLSGDPSVVRMDPKNQKWHTDGGIPSAAGWYFIETNTPLTVLQRQGLWAETYITKRSAQTKKVLNYSIAARAMRYSSPIAEYVNLERVYSGKASNLRDRARQHTFADPGTAALALFRYPELFQYSWSLGYMPLSRFPHEGMTETILLSLGERIWRQSFRWPLLCAE